MDSNVTPQAKKKPTVSDLSEELAIMRDDMSALTSTLTELVQNKSQEVTELAKAKADAAKASAQSTAEDAIDMVADAQRELEAVVRRHPATSLAVVAGIGFAMGLLSARR